MRETTPQNARDSNFANTLLLQRGGCSLSSPRPTLFHLLERVVGKRVIVVVERDYGYEGQLIAVSHHPPGIWISEAEAIVLRSTVVNPIPQVISKERKHELFLHLNSVLRIEAASESGKTSERR